MCDYKQVEYACGHLRYIVKAWCTTYQETQKRCPLNVIEMCALPPILLQIKSGAGLTIEQRISKK